MNIYLLDGAVCFYSAGGVALVGDSTELIRARDLFPVEGLQHTDVVSSSGDLHPLPYGVAVPVDDGRNDGEVLGVYKVNQGGLSRDEVVGVLTSLECQNCDFRPDNKSRARKCLTMSKMRTCKIEVSIKWSLKTLFHREAGGLSLKIKGENTESFEDWTNSFKLGVIRFENIPVEACTGQKKLLLLSDGKQETTFSIEADEGGSSTAVGTLERGVALGADYFIPNVNGCELSSGRVVSVTLFGTFRSTDDKLLISNDEKQSGQRSNRSAQTGLYLLLALVVQLCLGIV